MLRQRINQSESKWIKSPSSSQATTMDPVYEPKFGKRQRSTCNKSCTLKLLGFLLITVLAIVYIVIPVTFKYSSSLRRHILFMNYVNYQAFMNLDNPENEYKLKCTRVFKVASDDGVELGVWHIFPASRLKDCPDDRGKTWTKADEVKLFAGDSRPVILYAHGNGGTRGGNHRLELYRLMAYGKIDAHVIAFDYRGYGDSSPIPPSVSGVVNDAFNMYQWLAGRVNVSRINVWGHSLGTAISTSMVKRLEIDQWPNTLTLEAPFNNIIDAITEYPLSAIYKYYPLFDFFFLEPHRVPENSLFHSDVNIKDVKVPILILHAKDDAIVPYKLGERLFKAAMQGSLARYDTVKPKMIEFDGKLGYGHKNICKDPTLPDIVIDFFAKNLTRSDYGDEIGDNVPVKVKDSIDSST